LVCTNSRNKRRQHAQLLHTNCTNRNGWQCHRRLLLLLLMLVGVAMPCCSIPTAAPAAAV
jgi:hypothetical protein